MLDTNVLVAAVLSRAGAPAELLRAWRDGEFELVVSPLLLDELERVLAYPKLRAHVDEARAAALVDLLRVGADVRDEPGPSAALRSRDPDDDFLLALAAVGPAYLVTGDDDLLALADDAPVLSPRAFLDELRRQDG